MDPSHADIEESKLSAVEQLRDIRRCYSCGSAKHLRPNLPLRIPRQNQPIRNTAPNQKSGTLREIVDSL